MTALRKDDGIILSGKTLTLFVRLLVKMAETMYVMVYYKDNVHKFIFVLKKMTIIF